MWGHLDLCICLVQGWRIKFSTSVAPRWKPLDNLVRVDENPPHLLVNSFRIHKREYWLHIYFWRPDPMLKWVYLEARFGWEDPILVILKCFAKSVHININKVDNSCMCWMSIYQFQFIFPCFSLIYGLISKICLTNLWKYFS